jgi:hypothetical protein
MPAVKEHGPFERKTLFGGTKYPTGAGRLNWGEGIPYKPDKNMVKETRRKEFNITKVKKGVPVNPY